MNKNQQIQNQILELLTLSAKTEIVLYNLTKQYIPDITIKQFEANLSKLLKSNKIEQLNLIYYRKTNR